MNCKPENFILDVDGVLTDGTFYYSKEGKLFKQFGPEDTDTLRRLRELTNLNIEFVTADYTGYEINNARCEDMGFKCILVKNAYSRLDWLKENYNLDKTVYMGDSLTDIPALNSVYYSIVPNNALSYVKETANYITKMNGGHGAVAEACIELYDMFFRKDDENIISLFIKDFNDIKLE